MRRKLALVLLGLAVVLVAVVLNMYVPFKLFQWTYRSFFSRIAFEKPWLPWSRLALSAILVVVIFTTEVLALLSYVRRRS